MSCHGDYDSATSMCLERHGELSENDSKAFNVVEGDNTTTVYYQYNADTQSGTMMFPDEHHEEHHDEHHDEEFEMRYFMHFFNSSDSDNNQLLNMTELGSFIASIDAMEDDGSLTLEMMMIMYDRDESGGLSMAEFMGMFNNDVASNAGEASDMEAMLEAMFALMDANNDSMLSGDELSSLMEMMSDDDHDAAVATLHVRAEGDYGFALPSDVTMHIIAIGGHDDHAGHDDHDDHAGEERDDHDDHADEDGDDHADEEGDHDDHGDEESMNYDPHSWLDPLAFDAQSAVVLEALIAAFPEGQEDFEDNSETYSALLKGLDVAYQEAFGTDGVCQEKKVSANHNAYSYIAVRYGIQFETVHGLDPEGEPSPEDVAEVIEFIKEEGISVIFIEEYTDESSVQSIVDETGVSVKILYTMEMAPKDSSDNYMTLMGKNLQNLMDGMSCSVTADA
jgi:ABC-type Zn uptake system ZnuABC Zn-binding protein ZnuA/Ca2+-binding EF-hand superfamily protein